MVEVVRGHKIMKPLLKFILVAICLPVAAFCAFGFLASFEPGVRGAMFFRVVYGAVGLGCIGTIVAVVASAFRWDRR